MRGETIKISLKGHLMAFPWRPDDGLSLNYGLVSLQFFRESSPVLLRKPIFSDLSGGTGPTSPPPPPSGSAHASQEIFSHIGTFSSLNQY